MPGVRIRRWGGVTPDMAYAGKKSKVAWFAPTPRGREEWDMPINKSIAAIGAIGVVS
ncbi:MAG: hypothetical protein WC299_00480 [Kiritimatiellia bacterium]